MDPRAVREEQGRKENKDLALEEDRVVLRLARKNKSIGVGI